MTHSTDVLVVGGGATGVGVARDLAMRDVDVTLVERGGLASGTSGHSHGVLHSGARYADTDPADARDCIAENRALREIAGEAVADTGGFFVQLAGDDPEYFEMKVAACRDAGIPVDVLDGDAAREREPGLATDAERVAVVPDAVVYPSRLVAATAADARERGASVHAHAPVRQLLAEDGRVVGAEVAGVGRVDADHVVNATGVWAGDLAATAGVDVEMHPTKGAMVVVEHGGLDNVLNRCRPAADGDIVVPHEACVVLGTTSVEVDDAEDFSEDDREVETIVEECSDLLPAVADRDVQRVYWGVRPLYSPAVGDDGPPGRWVAESNSGGTRAISRGFYLLDHADRDDVAGLTTIVGGKLTTHRLMAEATADHVAARLGVDAPCRTAGEPLAGADDPARLDAFVDEFDAANPADANVRGE